MQLQEAKHEANLRKWREEVYNCRNSGMTVVGWCRQRGITTKTYYRWQKLVWEKESSALAERTAGQRALAGTGATVPAVAFEAVSLVGNGSVHKASEGITIRKGEWAVEIGSEKDMALLRQVLEILE